MSRVMPITGALVAALAAAPGAQAQVTSNQDSAVSPWPTVRTNPWPGATADTAFIRQAIRGNYTEVALGRLADSRAENDDVEDFAERMVSDHNSMNQKWSDLARKNNMKVGIEFGPNGQETIERLEDLSGTEFDRAYMTEMIRHHEQDLAAFQRMSTSATSAEVRQLSSSGASTIRQHLDLARQVGSRIGIASTAGRVGGVSTPTPTTTPAPVPSDDTTDARRRRTTVGRTTAAADADHRDDRDDRDGPRALRGEDRAFVQNVLSDHLMHVRRPGGPSARRTTRTPGAWPRASRRISAAGPSVGSGSPTGAMPR